MRCLGIDDQVKEVYDYLNEKAERKKGYDPKGVNSKFVKARLKDYSVEDLKRVIDIKVSQWKDTKWDCYLRPETLFNPTKFESYINEKPIQEKKNQFHNFEERKYTKEDDKEFMRMMDRKFKKKLYGDEND